MSKAKDGAIKEMREVPGLPGYFVTSTGEIHSNVQTMGRWKKKLSPCPDRYGYPNIEVTRDEKRVRIRVHRAIALAFLPPPLPGQTEVRHRDGDPSNNRLGNLLWGTHAENMADRAAHGRDPKGTKNGRAKIDARQAAEVRVLIAAKVTLTTIGKLYGLDRTTIRDIGLRKLWPEAPDADPASCAVLLQSIAADGQIESNDVSAELAALYADLVWDDLSGDNLSGKRAGRFTLRSYFRRDATHHWWLCDCACGTKDRPVRLNALRRHRAASCGCLVREISALRCKARYASGSR